MSGTKADGMATDLVLEFDLEARTETVWRAIDTPALRAKWLPGRLLTDAEELPSGPGRAVRFKMRDDEPPFLETTVTFAVLPRREGGSLLRITQTIPDVGALRRAPTAANSDVPPVMRAA